MPSSGLATDTRKLGWCSTGWNAKPPPFTLSTFKCVRKSRGSSSCRHLPEKPTQCLHEEYLPQLLDKTKTTCIDAICYGGGGRSLLPTLLSTFPLTGKFTGNFADF